MLLEWEGRKFRAGRAWDHYMHIFGRAESVEKTMPAVVLIDQKRALYSEKAR